METKCHLGFHGACIFCNAPIFATSSHVHSWNKKRGGHEQVCGSCYGLLLSASKLVLEAVFEIRGNLDYREIADIVTRGEVLVLVQAELDVFGASN